MTEPKIIDLHAPDAAELTDFERKLVEKSVRVEVPLAHATRMEIREIAGIYARAFQKCVALTHDERNERHMRTAIAYCIKDAQADVLVVKKAGAKQRERAYNARERERR